MQNEEQYMKKIIIVCAIVATSMQGMQGENFYYIYQYLREKSCDIYACLSPAYKRRRMLDTLMINLGQEPDEHEKLMSDHECKNESEHWYHKLCCALCLPRQ
jgi:hypothetical protein